MGPVRRLIGSVDFLRIIYHSIVWKLKIICDVNNNDKFCMKEKEEYGISLISSM